MFRVIPAAMFAFFMIPASAWANPPKGGDAPAARQPAGQQRVKTLIFDQGSDLEGGVDGPGGEQIHVARTLLHSNLIRVRTDFLPEIHKTAEDL